MSLDYPTKPRWTTATILYVEDNPMLAHPVKDALELAGWMVYHFTESAGGRTMIESNYRVDLMLLDYEIKHMTGLELTQQARKLAHRRETPIILYSVEDRAEEARRAGATEFLRKPANIHQLVELVRQMLAHAAPDKESPRTH